MIETSFFLSSSGLLRGPHIVDHLYHATLLKSSYMQYLNTKYISIIIPIFYNAKYSFRFFFSSIYRKLLAHRKKNGELF